jgi:hypothetical protein
MISFKDFFNESVNLGSSISNYIPLKDDYTITVYHGVDNERDLYGFLKYGTTGKMRAPRRYSYEANNNPYGIFVTIDLLIAKEFGGKYIIEFHTKVSDLEAPVWPDGNFTVQGQEAKYWNDNDERENYRNKRRSELRDNKYDFISQSDRPELAQTLYLNGEKQALFIGNLNSNSIKAIWVSRNPNRVNSTYDRYERREFINKFGDQLSKEGYDTDRNKMGNHVILKPRDEVTLDNIMNGLKRRYGTRPGFFSSEENLLKMLKGVRNKEQLHNLVWPHQMDKTMEIINNLKLNQS